MTRCYRPRYVIGNENGLDKDLPEVSLYVKVVRISSTDFNISSQEGLFFLFLDNNRLIKFLSC
jgi:hypothetical protein